MALTLKYYKALDALRARIPASQWRLSSPFHLDALAAKTIGEKLAQWILMRCVPMVLPLFRALWPNPRFGRLVVVTRAEDVKAVLLDHESFEVPFGREMNDLGGVDLVLGVDGEKHKALREILDGASKCPAGVEDDDIAGIVKQSGHLSKILIESSDGRIDVMKDLITRVASETCMSYLGVEGIDAGTFADWTFAMNMLCFADPFGDELTRRMALYSAHRAREVIDRSLANARAIGGAPETILGRLVARQRASGTVAVSDADIRGTLIALATGFVPVTTMCAGKILEELLKRPAELRKTLALAKATTADPADPARHALMKALFEAARLNPALSPGQWRYAKRDTVISPGKYYRRTVRAGSVLLVATQSALTDPRAFKNPSKFDPEHHAFPDLLFGDGIHYCSGARIVVAQITEILRVLLSCENLRPAKGRTGEIRWIGPYPRQLDMEFDSQAQRKQCMISIHVPLPSDVDVARMQGMIESLGNPAAPEIADAFKATRVVHFASLCAVDLGTPEKSLPHLILELNVDGPRDRAIALVAEKAQARLTEIFQYSRPGEPLGLGALTALLSDHAVEFAARPGGNAGVYIYGTPGFSVQDIEEQAQLAAFAREALELYLEDHIRLGSRAMTAIQYVRMLIRGQGVFAKKVRGEGSGRINDLRGRGAAFADTLIRPNRQHLNLSRWKDRSNWQAAQRLLASPTMRGAGAAILVAWLLLTIVTSVAWGRITLSWTNSLEYVGRLLVSLGASGVVLLVVLMLAALTFVLLLHRDELADWPDDSNPRLTDVKAIAKRENDPDCVQNHLTAVVLLKSGWVREITFGFSVWFIEQLSKYWYRPGFVRNIGTIHFAKWFRPARSASFLFQSNYDGSWESYLEDFITKGHNGQSAVWSNGVGFPRTNYLFFQGAEDGDRFKRWIRRHQIVTPFWYSRFPKLTTTQIRTNALIHDGLVHASTDTAARDWLDCFGSMQRPDYAIEASEVQSLVFRGLREMPYALCALVRFGEIDPSKWLDALVDGTVYSEEEIPDCVRITFGDRPFSGKSGDTASFVAFSSAGLCALDLGEPAGDSGLATFSAPFNIGMNGRGRVLRDFNTDSWRWSDAAAGARGAHAALLIFGPSQEQCLKTLAAHEERLGGKAFHVVKTQPAEKGIDYEHFGFRDGISQPIIHGTQRSNKPSLPRDIVEPGEFILGYRNNEGYFPPSPFVLADTDPDNRLPVIEAQEPLPYPTFRASGAASDIRDIGRNGTFLVIRELAQDIAGFSEFTAEKAEEVKNRYHNIANVTGGPVTADWIGAKMMGRWQDGTPLIDRAFSGSSTPLRHRGGPSVTAAEDSEGHPDNDFAYGEDDAQGLQCPLGAHIRRTNPRDGLDPGDPMQQSIVNRHRILRRGRSYAYDPDGKEVEKGLLFMCVCADLERQFEFLQQTWIGSPVFQGLVDEPDPIAAQSRPHEPRNFTIPTAAGTLTLKCMKSFVSARAGGYFFLPGRSAIQYLADLARSRSSAGAR